MKDLLYLSICRNRTSIRCGISSGRAAPGTRRNPWCTRNPCHTVHLLAFAAEPRLYRTRMGFLDIEAIGYWHRMVLIVLHLWFNIISMTCRNWHLWASHRKRAKILLLMASCIVVLTMLMPSDGLLDILVMEWPSAYLLFDGRLLMMHASLMMTTMQ